MRVFTSTMTIVRLALLGSLAAAAPLLAAGHETAGQAEHDLHGHDRPAPARLVQIVREVTEPFKNPGAATDAGYGPAFGCVSGPQEGAMGVHYVNGGLVMDGEIDARTPEALLYEFSKGRAHLLGVEYIVVAEEWFKHHSEPPMLEGQAFQLVSAPNRFNLPTFFELHVWAWRDNPHGAFVDWNTEVSCEGQ
jgi:hypothetical protein